MKKQVEDAILTLKSECERYGDCPKCPLYLKERKQGKPPCALLNLFPVEWDKIKGVGTNEQCKSC